MRLFDYSTPPNGIPIAVFIVATRGPRISLHTRSTEVEVEVVRPIVKWIQDNVNPICIGINAVSRGQLGEDRGAIVLKSTPKINALLGIENMYIAAYAFGCWHGFWKILFQFRNVCTRSPNGLVKYAVNGNILSVQLGNFKAFFLRILCAKANSGKK